MRDLVPCPGIETRPPALGAQSLNHWTTREVPALRSFNRRSDMVRRWFLQLNKTSMVCIGNDWRWWKRWAEPSRSLLVLTVSTEFVFFLKRDHMTQQFHYWVYIQKTPKTLIWKDTCTPIFIAALFKVAKIWKQPKCPSTDEWIKKMWCIYKMEYYSAIKKNQILPFVTTWMDLEGIMLSEIIQTEKDKYCMISPICGI